MHRKFGADVKVVDHLAADLTTRSQALGRRALLHIGVWNLVVVIAHAAYSQSLNAVHFVMVGGMVFLLVFVVGIGSLRREQVYKSAQRNIENGERFGIWLRRFGVDNSGISAGHNIEDMIARTSSFPLIAIDNVLRPNISGGSVRMAASHSKWQEIVAYLADHSSFIIVYLPPVLEDSMMFEVQIAVSKYKSSGKFVILLFSRQGFIDDFSVPARMLEMLSDQCGVIAQVRKGRERIAGICLCGPINSAFYAAAGGPIAYARKQASWVNKVLTKYSVAP